MIHIDFICENDHGIDINIPDRAFDQGPLIIPCPSCGMKYIVEKNGRRQRYKHRVYQFPQLHFEP